MKLGTMLKEKTKGGGGGRKDNPVELKPKIVS